MRVRTGRFRSDFPNLVGVVNRDPLLLHVGNPLLLQPTVDGNAAETRQAGQPHRCSCDTLDLLVSEEIQFQFRVQDLPEGEAVTKTEMEQRLRDALAASGGKDIDTLWSLAVLYSETQRLDESAGCIRNVIELTDDLEIHGSCHLALGQLEERRGDYEAAANRYRAALSLEPCSSSNWYFIHNNLGFSLNQVGEHEAAVPYLEVAVEIDPARPNAYKNLALSFEALGDVERAAELFIAATQADASDSRSLAHLEALVEAHPALLVDVPSLAESLDACRKAVELAKGQQPDFDAHWAKAQKS
ncbi:MAG: tetratricopeptide (TPR) repeat protein [Kiritimatiellia bacterium]|jgi:tetratricopeptide (TPR) repeat protein